MNPNTGVGGNNGGQPRKANKILIVEEEEQTATDLRQRLEHLGYLVAGHALSGDDAMALALRELPDIVLMDTQLKGGMDGIEAAGHLRKTLRLPIIYITAQTDRVTLHRAKQTGPLGYLVKPFTDQDLYSAIEIALHRHAMERTGREHREWLGAILRSMADAVVATDELGRIRFLNPVAENITGWSEVEAIGRSFHEIVNLVEPDSCQPVGPVSDAVFSRDKVKHRQLKLRHRDSLDEILVEDSATTITDGDTIRGGVFVFRDITDRLRVEEELQHTERMESLSRLAGRVAHDFNNLLAIIQDVSGISLTECGDDAALRERFTAIADAAIAAGDLTRRLLAVGREDVFELKPLDVNELLHEMCDMLRPALGDGVQLEIQTLAKRSQVLADRRQLQRAILNIFLNARDAVGDSDSGLVLVETEDTWLSNETYEPGGVGAVSIAIADTGAGIPPELKARIFEPFFTTKERLGGTGLGLAIAHGIISKSGGRIEVESEIGNGSRFTILLPVCD